MGWDGMGGKGLGWEEMREEGTRGDGRGPEGLLKFHFIFQKTWAVPGNPT